MILSFFVFSCTEIEQRKVNTIVIPGANQKSEDMAKMSFDNELYEFGKIMEGENISYSFHFENTGNSDLVISDVLPECGCTSAKNWSKKPYRPGEKGEITITFKSEGRPGATDKRITVISNAFPSVTDLRLKGEVIGPNK